MSNAVLSRGDSFYSTLRLCDVFCIDNWLFKQVTHGFKKWVYFLRCQMKVSENSFFVEKGVNFQHLKEVSQFREL